MSFCELSCSHIRLAPKGSGAKVEFAGCSSPGLAPNLSNAKRFRMMYPFCLIVVSPVKVGYDLLLWCRRITTHAPHCILVSTWHHLPGTEHMCQRLLVSACQPKKLHMLEYLAESTSYCLPDLGGQRP